MKLTIHQKKEIPLLSRTEIEGEISYDAATPSKGDVQKQLSTTLKADQKLLVVKHIYSPFGKKQGRLLAYLYKDQKALEMIEPKSSKEAKSGEKQAKPEAAQPAKQEKPAETAAAKPEEKKAT